MSPEQQQQEEHSNPSHDHAAKAAGKNWDFQKDETLIQLVDFSILKTTTGLPY